MPNWCQGIMKVRGTKEKLLKFLNEGIERRGFPRTESDDYTIYPLNITENDYNEVNIRVTDEEHNSWLYFKDSRRMFIESNIEWYFWGEDGETEIKILDIKQAWNIEADYLQEVSKKFNIDIRVEAYECGCAFKQEIEIINGEITIDKVIEYDDYNWEAYDPRLGG